MRIERLLRDPLTSTPDSPDFTDPRGLAVTPLFVANGPPTRPNSGDFAWLLAEATMVDAEWSQRDASSEA
jgi:hypothetical protein